MVALARYDDEEPEHLPQNRRDYTKWYECPECKERLHGIKDNEGPHNPKGVIWLCRRAIGELAWDGTWRRHYFPSGSAHVGGLKQYVEGLDGKLRLQHDPSNRKLSPKL